MITKYKIFESNNNWTINKVKDMVEIEGVVHNGKKI